ncbi:MAG: hypothetical protein WKF55_01745 [Gemmatimonadaceae bacterium]
MRRDPAVGAGALSQRVGRAAERGKCNLVSAGLAAEYPHNPNLSSWLVTLSFGAHVSPALLEWYDEADDTLSRRR